MISNDFSSLLMEEILGKAIIQAGKETIISQNRGYTVFFLNNLNICIKTILSGK